MTLPKVFDVDRRVASSQCTKKLLRDLIPNLQPVKEGFDLSSLDDISIYNLFMMLKVSKLDLEIRIKWIHGKSLAGCTKIFGSGLIRSSMINGQLSTINVKEPYSMGDGIVPPLNPPRFGVGPRLKIPHLNDMGGSG